MNQIFQLSPFIGLLFTALSGLKVQDFLFENKPEDTFPLFVRIQFRGSN